MYLASHYWTNAVMHGANDGQLEAARNSCSAVLDDQLLASSPQVIIAGGKVAAQSLHQIAVLKQPWSSLRHALRRGAYSERTTLRNGEPATVFVTYHASARSVNQTVSALYGDDVEVILDRRLAALPTAGEARRFLRRYDRASTTGRGMRLLLLHWFDIGTAVRHAHGATA